MTNDQWNELIQYAKDFVITNTKAQLGGNASYEAVVEQLQQHYPVHDVNGYKAAFKTAVVDLVIHTPGG